ncbi:MAG TPA: hypothetical protein VNM91_07590 [Dehalococcoidia bacterium]|nr:hypothetical protein [Dehalococcoidia bacterium]
MRSRWWVVLGVLALTPAAGEAQVSPTAAPHPTMPWALGTATPYGQFVRDVWVPPQQVVLETVVPLPPAAPAAPDGAPADRADAPSQAGEPTATVVRQVVTVPGYYVRETTVGYHYPARWTIEQTAPGSYRWRLLPQEFRHR